MAHDDGIHCCYHMSHHLEAANLERMMESLVSDSVKVPALGQHPAGVSHYPPEHRICAGTTVNEWRWVPNTLNTCSRNQGMEDSFALPTDTLGEPLA